MTLDTLNGMDRESFVAAVGWIFEHSPWVAERAWDERPFADGKALLDAMIRQVKSAGATEQLALLCAHPDLGRGTKLSGASASEQAGAGLDTLTPEEFEQFTDLNELYRAKFGFPFICAVKGWNKRDILNALIMRLGAGRDDEFADALREVYRIAEFRLDGYLARES